MSGPVLELEDLTVSFSTDDGVVHAVDGVSLAVQKGESLGIVGESGSGKSVTFMTAMGLTRGRNTQISGHVRLQGRELLDLSESDMQKVRGKEIGMIFQDPMTSLHPYYRVGDQIAEAIRAHEDVSKKQAGDRAVELLGMVAIPHPAERAAQYPHEFSGGMRQRAMIAMSLALHPEVLIADEPTTALDVTVQAQIMDLINRLRDELGTAVVVVTHDLGVVAEYCDRIGVMYGGRIIEEGPTDDIYADAFHPYTWGLLGSLPRLDEAGMSRLTPISGTPPSLFSPPTGCMFHPRCPHVMDVCRLEVPPLEEASAAHLAACHLTLEERRRIFREQRAPEGVS